MSINLERLVSLSNGGKMVNMAKKYFNVELITYTRMLFKKLSNISQPNFSSHEEIIQIIHCKNLQCLFEWFFFLISKLQTWEIEKSCAIEESK